jgi:hypothetical protein
MGAYVNRRKYEKKRTEQRQLRLFLFVCEEEQSSDNCVIL